MYKNTTDIEFHKAMKGILDKYDENFMSGVFDNKDYYEMVKGKSQKEIFRDFLPREGEKSYEMDYRQKMREGYLEDIASINYEAAMELSGLIDNEIVVEGFGEVKIPFYLDDLNLLDVEVHDGKLVFVGVPELGVERKEGEYFQIEERVVCQTTLKDGMVVGCERGKERVSNDDDLNKYSVSYEMYSSYYVDPGKTVVIWAKNEEEAVSVAMAKFDSPEDGILNSYSVNGNDYGNTSSSYLYAIEEPGIARAEAAQRKEDAERDIDVAESVKQGETVSDLEVIQGVFEKYDNSEVLTGILMEVDTLIEFIKRVSSSIFFDNDILNRLFSELSNEEAVSLEGFFQKKMEKSIPSKTEKEKSLDKTTTNTIAHRGDSPS